MTFQELNLSAPLLRAVAEAGYTTPSPIQAGAIPPVAAGRDLMGCAQTGTGKTAAFALPMLQRLSSAPPRKKGAVRALILTPTRELALQIGESFAAYGKYLKLKHTVIFGGVGQAPQVAALQKGVDILIACPGRLNDLIGQGHVHLDDLEIFVLDEADRMLDMGFVHDVKKVIARLPRQRQNLMFSATMPAEIEQLAQSILHDPAFVKVDPPSSTVERIAQTLYYVPDKTAKRALLPHLINALQVENALVFSRTKHGADRIAKDLCKQGIPAAAIHGNKSQSARVAALEGFKAGKTRVLVATDIAARGIDINELAYVFNFDLPEVPETYVHRIGRTARAGADGCAVSFCTPEEREYLAGIEKLNRRRIPVVADHPWHDPTAPTAEPVPVTPVKRAKQPPKPQSAASAQPAAAPADQNTVRNEESSMEKNEKRPAEAQGSASTGAKRRRRRRGSGKGGEAAVPAAAKTEAAAPKQGGKQNAQPRAERGQNQSAPRRERAAQPQQPKFDPRFLTAGAAQAVRGNAPAAQTGAAKQQPANGGRGKGQQNQNAQPAQNAKQNGKAAAKQQPKQEAKQAQSVQNAPAKQNGGRGKGQQPQQQPEAAKTAKAQQPARQPEAAKAPKAQQPARQPEAPKAPKAQQPRQNPRGKAQPRRGKEDDPGLILISRRPPQQKFASFEEYMEAHGGATAPVEDYSNE